MAKNEVDNGKLAIADRIRNLKMYTSREWLRLYEILTAPNFTGTVSLSLSAKSGRPGEPKVTIEEYGVRDN